MEADQKNEEGIKHSVSVKGVPGIYGSRICLNLWYGIYVVLQVSIPPDLTADDGWTRRCCRL